VQKSEIDLLKNDFLEKEKQISMFQKEINLKIKENEKLFAIN
jgi:hypothetical protein